MKQHHSSGLDSLYDLCRVSGGSMTLIESTVRQVAGSSGGGGASGVQFGRRCGVERRDRADQAGGTGSLAV
jgi:hypothetical protein